MLGTWVRKPSIPVRKPVLPQPAVLGRLPRVGNPFPGHGEVAFYMWGRIRLYIRELKGQEGYKKVLWEKLEDFRQMGHLDMNSRTGLFSSCMIRNKQRHRKRFGPISAMPHPTPAAKALLPDK